MNEPAQRPLAVVIGAGGMGLAVARRLGQVHRILLVDIDKDRAAQAATELAASGIEASACTCDVTSQASVQALADEIAGLGGWTALAHVVGLSPSMGNFQQILEVNLVGARWRPARLGIARAHRHTHGPA